MKVCVIGLGVGMAHVCALVRTNHTISALVDIDPVRLHNAKKQWKNVWADLVEEVEVDQNCEYSTSFTNLSNFDFDLVIAAVPPHAQKTVLKEIRSMFTGPVLLEKPLVVTEEDLDDFVYVCCEWITHSKITNFKKIESLRMSYEVGFEPWKSEFAVYDDLMPHLYSILLSLDINVTLLRKYESKSWCRMSTQCDDDIITLEVCRMPPYGLQINGEQLDWELDLFDKYYNSMILAKQLLSYEKNIILR